jgi:hypothetical protein
MRRMMIWLLILGVGVISLGCSSSNTGTPEKPEDKPQLKSKSGKQLGGERD